MRRGERWAFGSASFLARTKAAMACGDPNGTRTRVFAVKGRQTPDDLCVRITNKTLTILMLCQLVGLESASTSSHVYYRDITEGRKV